MQTFSGLAAILERDDSCPWKLSRPRSELKFKFQILWDWKLAAALST